MRAFAYERPTSLADALALLAERGPDARPLAGGTDLIIRLRDRSVAPSVVMDVKRIAELDDAIREDVDRRVIGARASMTSLAADPGILRDHRALAEAAAVVGSVQIRNRATLAGNICNASPAADTAPALLVDDATVVVVGVGGTRRIPIDAFFVRSGVTTLAPDELVTAIELPRPVARRGTVHLRRTRRRGHDLASVTLACSVAGDGITRIAYGSLGPRRSGHGSPSCSSTPAPRRPRCARARTTAWRCCRCWACAPWSSPSHAATPQARNRRRERLDAYRRDRQRPRTTP